MAKVKRGIPEGFDLQINTSSPAILGDFLDEVVAMPPPIIEARARTVPEPEKREPVVELVPERREAPKEIRAERGREEEIPEPVAEKRTSGRVVELKPPRMELSLNHETKRMIQELMLYVQQMLPQSPAKASELFQGIISVLYRAKGSLDLSSVPRRGQWGSPTAKAFPFALGQAFAKAIADQYMIENSKKSVG
jgi:hypothetical protein